MHTSVPLEGDIIPQAIVIRHLEQEPHQGIVFRLNRQHEGVFWRDQMSVFEWKERDVLYGVNSSHDVEVTSSVFNKKKQLFQLFLVRVQLCIKEKITKHFHQTKHCVVTQLLLDEAGRLILSNSQ